MSENSSLWAWRKTLAPAVILITLLGLALHPLPMCFACEPDPYALLDPHYILASRIFVIWLVGSSFFSSLARLNGFLLVPVGITFADLATQHLGGVPWWSLYENEGPVLILEDLFFGFIAVGFGLLASQIWTRLIRRGMEEHCDPN